jgi:hypothetical protein
MNLGRLPPLPIIDRSLEWYEAKKQAEEAAWT